MKIYTLKFKQKINRKIDEVYPFFSNPENLSYITPSRLNFRILTPLPIKMQKGQIIDYTITILGKKIRWRTIISEYEPSKYFIDQQLKGPYSKWDHTHIFKECKNGTMMIDKVTYSIPLGIIGQLAHSIWGKAELNRIFNYRYDIIEKIFKGE